MILFKFLNGYDSNRERERELFIAYKVLWISLNYLDTRPLYLDKLDLNLNCNFDC